MGLEKAKSLLVVKDGRTFLDLIAFQVGGWGCEGLYRICAGPQRQGLEAPPSRALTGPRRVGQGYVEEPAGQSSARL
jgi:hypothetical protein